MSREINLVTISMETYNEMSSSFTNRNATFEVFSWQHSLKQKSQFMTSWHSLKD